MGISLELDFQTIRYIGKMDILFRQYIFKPSLFYKFIHLYTTTTYPDIVVGDKTGVVKSNLFWLWFVTSIIFLIFSYMLFFNLQKLQHMQEENSGQLFIRFYILQLS